MPPCEGKPTYRERLEGLAEELERLAGPQVGVMNAQQVIADKVLQLVRMQLDAFAPKAPDAEPIQIVNTTPTVLMKAEAYDELRANLWKRTKGIGVLFSTREGALWWRGRDGTEGQVPSLAELIDKAIAGASVPTAARTELSAVRRYVFDLLGWVDQANADPADGRSAMDAAMELGKRLANADAVRARLLYLLGWEHPTSAHRDTRTTHEAVDALTKKFEKANELHVGDWDKLRALLELMAWLPDREAKEASLLKLAQVTSEKIAKVRERALAGLDAKPGEFGAETLLGVVHLLAVRAGEMTKTAHARGEELVKAQSVFRELKETLGRERMSAAAEHIVTAVRDAVAQADRAERATTELDRQLDVYREKFRTLITHWNGIESILESTKP